MTDRLSMKKLILIITLFSLTQLSFAQNETEEAYPEDVPEAFDGRTPNSEEHAPKRRQIVADPSEVEESDNYVDVEEKPLPEEN
jgi:hypothetical protein